MSKLTTSLVVASLFTLGLEARASSMESSAQELCRSLTHKSCKTQNLTRRALSQDVAEYSFDLKVGPKAQDQIRIYRVVREKKAGHPVKTGDGVFLVHGDAFGFKEIFLAGLSAPEGEDQNSYALYLAQHGVDVWGLDRRWVRVKKETTDFNFMKNWNVQTEIEDIGKAMQAARLLRLKTGSGLEKLTLNGWSSGAFLTYAFANAEAQIPKGLRSAKAMIPMDIAFKFSPDAEAERQKSCGRLAGMQNMYAAGVYHVEGGTGPATLGFLADAFPTEASPAIPGLTNFQAAMFLGGFIYLADPSFDVVPVFHQTAAEVDGAGTPQGLLYTEEQFFIDFLQLASPYMNLGTRIDMEVALCDETNSRHDDALAKIKIPTLYVGGAGGFGVYGTHTQSLLGSSDVTNLVIQKLPSEQRLFDYGHSDLFLADSAKEDVWAPILQWIKSH